MSVSDMDGSYANIKPVAPGIYPSDMSAVSIVRSCWEFQVNHCSLQ